MLSLQNRTQNESLWQFDDLLSSIFSRAHIYNLKKTCNVVFQQLSLSAHPRPFFNLIVIHTDSLASNLLDGSQEVCFQML